MKITKLPNGGSLWEYNSGKFYYMNDKRHREDGPAREYPEGDKEWWINGEVLPCKTQKQFEQLMRLKIFW